MDGATRHNALINRLSEMIESSRRNIIHQLSAVGNREENLQTEPAVDARIHLLFSSVNNVNRSRPSHNPTHADRCRFTRGRRAGFTWRLA